MYGSKINSTNYVELLHIRTVMKFGVDTRYLVVGTCALLSATFLTALQHCTLLVFCEVQPRLRTNVAETKHLCG